MVAPAGDGSQTDVARLGKSTTASREDEPGRKKETDQSRRPSFRGARGRWGKT